MAKQIEIEIRGITFTADMLEDKAPKTCRAILGVLPLEAEGYHQVWSGQSLIIHSPVLIKAVEEQGLWPSSSFPDFRENANIIGCPGELALYPVGGSICISYGKSLYGGSIGPEPSYHFARISADIDKLYEVGSTFRREGGQKIKIRLKNSQF